MSLISAKISKNSAFFIKNMDFFEENERFCRLIKHYSLKGKSKEIEADLWAFLWEFYQRKPRPPSDNYIAVSIKNEFLRLINFNKKSNVNEQFLPPCVYDFDFFIDFKCALFQLSDRERECFFLNVVYGFSVYEIAAFFEITPQAVCKNKNRALTKLRKILE